MDNFKNLVDFCKYFISYSSNFNKLSGGNIAGYKSKHKNCYSVIKSSNADADIFLDNFLESSFNIITAFELTNLFDSSEKIADEYDQISIVLQFIFLCCHRSTQLSNKTLSSTQVTELEKVKSHFAQHFEDEFYNSFEEKFIKQHNNSRSSNQQLNVNEFASELLSVIRSLSSQSTIISHNSNNNAISTTNTTQMSNMINSNLSTNSLSIEESLMHYLTKILKLKSHLNVMKTHKHGSLTTPKQFAYNRFPRPFFGHNKNFIEKYNIIIKEAQKSIFDLIETTIEEELQEYTNSILNLKKTLINNKLYDESNIDSYMNKLESKAENNLDKFLKSADEAAKKIKNSNFKTEYEVLSPSKKTYNSSPQNESKRSNGNKRKRHNSSYSSKPKPIIKTSNTPNVNEESIISIDANEYDSENSIYSTEFNKTSNKTSSRNNSVSYKKPISQTKNITSTNHSYNYKNDYTHKRPSYNRYQNQNSSNDNHYHYSNNNDRRNSNFSNSDGNHFFQYGNRKNFRKRNQK